MYIVFVLGDVLCARSEMNIPLNIQSNWFVLLQVEGHNLILNFWKRSLNPMTWTEIFRQVLIAAGYGLNHGTSASGSLVKVFK